MAEAQRDEIAKLEALYAANPEGRVFAHLAEAYRKAGELEHARRILEQGLVRHPDFASAYVVLGKVERDRADHDAARRAFGEVLARDGGNLIALQSLAELALERGDRDEALRHYGELLNRDLMNTELRDRVEQLRHEQVAPGATEGTGLAAAAGSEAVEESVGEVEQPAAPVPELAAWVAETRPVPADYRQPPEDWWSVDGGSHEEAPPLEAAESAAPAAGPGEAALPEPEPGALEPEPIPAEAAPVESADLDVEAIELAPAAEAPGEPEYPGADAELVETPASVPEGPPSDWIVGAPADEMEDRTAEPSIAEPEFQPAPAAVPALPESFETPAAEVGDEATAPPPDEETAAVAPVLEAPSGEEPAEFESAAEPAWEVPAVVSAEAVKPPEPTPEEAPATEAGFDEPAPVEPAWAAPAPDLEVAPAIAGEAEPMAEAVAESAAEAVAPAEAVAESAAEAVAPDEAMPVAGEATPPEPEPEPWQPESEPEPAPWAVVEEAGEIQLAPEFEAPTEAVANLEELVSIGEFEGPPEPGAESAEAGLLTETMAELYRRQGFADRAADVYRSLLEREPGSERLQALLNEVEAEHALVLAGRAQRSARDWLDDVQEVESAFVGGGGAVQGGDSPYAWGGGEEPAAAGPPIGEYFRGLLAWRPAAAAAAAVSAALAAEVGTGGAQAAEAGELLLLEEVPGDAPAPAQAVAGSAAELQPEPEFPGWTPADLDEPAEPVTGRAAAATDLMPWEFAEPTELAGEGGAGQDPPAAPGSGTAAGGELEAEDEDLEIFRSWLQSLKK